MKKPKSEIVDKIFEYSDYRNFLKDYFDEQKQLRKVFTFRYFAEKAGFSAHSFCMRVISGTRNLGNASIVKFIDAMELNGKKAKYFELLVKYNQTSDTTKKQLLIRELDTLRLSTKLFNDTNDKLHTLFSKWYYSVVRELVVCSNWKGDYDLLASMIIPAISSREAMEAVELMIETGFLVVNDDGSYSMPQNFLSGDSVNLIIKKKYRRDVLAQGVTAADTFNANERFTTASTLTLSKNAYEKIVNKYKEAIDEILSIAATDNDEADRVYQLTTNVFPVTVSLIDNKGRKR